MTGTPPPADIRADTPADTQAELWHSMADLAELTGRSERTLFRWLAAGKVEACDGPDGTLYRLTRADGGAAAADMRADTSADTRMSVARELAEARATLALRSAEVAELRVRLEAERERAELRVRLAEAEAEAEVARAAGDAEHARTLAEVATRDAERAEGERKAVEADRARERRAREAAEAEARAAREALDLERQRAAELADLAARPWWRRLWRPRRALPATPSGPVEVARVC